MLIGLLISLMALVGFSFAVLLLIAVIFKYTFFLLTNRESSSRVGNAMRYMCFKDQANDISVPKIFYLSIAVSLILVVVVGNFGS
jgi:hypothetical protein